MAKMSTLNGYEICDQTARNAIAKHTEFHFGTTAMYSKGFYKININSGTSWMLHFTIRVYQNYNYSDILISGYNYGKNYWYSPKTELISSSVNSIDVKFGYDGVGSLWVAIPASNYAGITILGVNNGYTQVSDWSNKFTIKYMETLTGTVQNTITAHRSLKVNEAASHNHSAANITSGTLPLARGGTGVTTFTGTSGLIHNMFDGNLTGANYIPVFTDSWADGGYMSKQQLRNALGLGNTLGAVPIANGGTGGTTAATARTNLDVYSKSESNSRRLYASPVTIGANADNIPYENRSAQIFLSTQSDLNGTDNSYWGDAGISVHSAVLSGEDNISSLYNYVSMDVYEVKNSDGALVETKYARAEFNTDESLKVESSDCGFRHEHVGTGNTVAFGVGSGGTNRGVYDTTKGKWMINNNDSGNTFIPQPLIVQGHSTAIGSQVTKGDSTDISLSTDAWKNLKSISLPAGSWVITGNSEVTVSGNHKIGLGISKTSATAEGACRQYLYTTPSSIQQNVARVLVISATTTVYLIGYSSASGDKVTYSGIYAVRIA